uniref:Uncharacterized protein n=1 Tax=Glossina palpalis gambiensis TaxID=67801 RepID=A0A1B0BK24_9MUSC
MTLSYIFWKHIFLKNFQRRRVNIIEKARRSNAWAESSFFLLKLQVHGGRFKSIKILKASISNIKKLPRSFNELPCEANCFCSEEKPMQLMRLHQHQPKI